MNTITLLLTFVATLTLASTWLPASVNSVAGTTASQPANESKISSVMNIGSCMTDGAPTWCNAPVIRFQRPGSGYSGTWFCVVTGGKLANGGQPATCSASVRKGGLLFAITSPGQYSQMPTDIVFKGGSFNPGTVAQARLDNSSTTGEWINAALENCRPSGCKVEVPPSDGEMDLNEPLVVSTPNTHLTCDTKDPMKITYKESFAGPNGYFLNPIDISADNVELDGCHIDVSAAGTSSMIAIEFFGATNGKAHNNQITSAIPSTAYQARGPLGIRVEGSPDKQSQWINVFDNDITVPYIGLSTGNFSYYVNFHDNRVVNSYQCFDLNGSGRSPNISASVNVTDNQCVNDTSSSYVESAYAINIKGNFFWYNGIAKKNGEAQAMLRIHAVTAYNLQNTLVSGNQFYGAPSGAYGIHIFNGSNNVEVIGNQFFNIGLDAILIDGSEGGISSGLLQGNYIQKTGINSDRSSGMSSCGIHIQTAGARANVWNISILDNVIQQSPTAICHTDSSAQAAIPLALKILGNDITAPSDVPYGNKVSLSLPYGCDGCTIGPNHVSNSAASRFYGSVLSDSLVTTATTVAALPACSRTTVLQRRAVTDARTSAPGSLLVGGGPFTIAVQCVFDGDAASYFWMID